MRAAGLLLIFPAAAYAAFSAGPYPQDVRTTSVIFLWETSASARGVLEYGTASYTDAVTEPSAVTRHKITLTGLAPRTHYIYRVRETMAASTGPGGAFWTAPSGSLAFKFIVYGDNRRNYFIVENDNTGDHAAVV